jgi:hypothetical protein
MCVYVWFGWLEAAAEFARTCAEALTALHVASVRLQTLLIAPADATLQCTGVLRVAGASRRRFVYPDSLLFTAFGVTKRESLCDRRT